MEDVNDRNQDRNWFHKVLKTPWGLGIKERKKKDLGICSSGSKTNLSRFVSSQNAQGQKQQSNAVLMNFRKPLKSGQQFTSDLNNKIIHTKKI